MAITRAQYEKELRPGINTLIGLSYKQYKGQWNRIFKQESSKMAYEEAVKLVGTGYAARKDEGAMVTMDDGMGEAWASRYNHVTYALGFTITQEAIEDNLYMKLGKRYSQAVGNSMAQTKEINAANVFNLGFSTNPDFQCGDGQSLFASHNTQSGVANVNYASVAVDLNEAALENALIQVQNFKDERGLKINANGTKLLIPNSLQFVAKRLTMSEYRPGTNDNDVNATKGLLSETIINNFLTNPSSWFLLTDIDNGAKHYNRRSMQVEDQPDFMTGNFMFKATERYSFGYDDPLFAYGSQGGN
jgi:hypothetical protein